MEATHTQDYYFDQTLGKISEINVQDGQEVEQGATLLSYTNTEYQEQADEQSTNLDKLYLAVSNAQESLAIAQDKQAKEQRQTIITPMKIVKKEPPKKSNISKK